MERTKTFLEVAKYLEENDDEQIDLISTIETIIADSICEAYGRVYMQSKHE